MGIHDDQKGVLIGHFQSLLVGNKVVHSRSGRLFVQAIQSIGSAVDHDGRRLVADDGHTVDPQGCTEAVHVRALVTHDDHVGCLVDLGLHGVGHDPGLSFVSLLYGLQSTAEVFYGVYLLDNDLVAAST